MQEPKCKREMLRVAVGRELKERLRRRAFDRWMSTAALVRQALTEFLDRPEPAEEEQPAGADKR